MLATTRLAAKLRVLNNDMVGFFTQLLIAILSWIEERAKRGHVAVDADADDTRVRRAGTRLREWMRSNRSSQLGKPNSDRASESGTDLHSS